MDILLGKSGGVALGEECLHVDTVESPLARHLGDHTARHNVHESTDLREVVYRETLPMLNVGKDHHRVGVIDDRLHILSRKGRQDRHHDRPIGDDAHPVDAPLGAVLTDECHPLSLLDLEGLEEQLRTCHPSRHVSVAKGLAGVVIGQRCQRPRVSKRLLVGFDERCLYHIYNPLVYKL